MQQPVPNKRELKSIQLGGQQCSIINLELSESYDSSGQICIVSIGVFGQTLFQLPAQLQAQMDQLLLQKQMLVQKEAYNQLIAIQAVVDNAHQIITQLEQLHLQKQEAVHVKEDYVEAQNIKDDTDGLLVQLAALFDQANLQQTVDTPFISDQKDTLQELPLKGQNESKLPNQPLSEPTTDQNLIKEEEPQVEKVQEAVQLPKPKLNLQPGALEERPIQSAKQTFQFDQLDENSTPDGGRLNIPTTVSTKTKKVPKKKPVTPVASLAIQAIDEDDDKTLIASDAEEQFATPLASPIKRQSSVKKKPQVKKLPQVESHKPFSAIPQAPQSKKKGDDQVSVPSDLSQAEKFFGEEFIQCVAVKDFTRNQWTLEYISAELQLNGKFSEDAHSAVLDVATFFCQDTREKILSAAYSVLEKLLDKKQHPIEPSVALTLAVASKCNDQNPRVRSGAQQLFTKLVATQESIPAVLTKACLAKPLAPKVLCNYLQALSLCANQSCYNATITVCLDAFANNSKDVRDGAVNVLVCLQKNLVNQGDSMVTERIIDSLQSSAIKPQLIASITAELNGLSITSRNGSRHSLTKSSSLSQVNQASPALLRKSMAKTSSRQVSAKNQQQANRSETVAAMKKEEVVKVNSSVQSSFEQLHQVSKLPVLTDTKQQVTWNELVEEKPQIRKSAMKQTPISAVEEQPRPLSLIDEEPESPHKPRLKSAHSTQNETLKRQNSLARSVRSSSPDKSLQGTAADVDLEKTCIFCDVYNENFNDQILDVHYWQDCSMLTVCQQCQRVVEVGTLTLEHYATGDCVEEGKQCDRCHLYIPKSMYKEHVNKKKCAEASLDDVVCPLCFVKIGTQINRDSYFKKHLMSDGCRKSQRSMTFVKNQPSVKRSKSFISRLLRRTK